MEEKERMNEMIETIMKVARGDYSVQIEVSDENADIDSLAIGLNMMIDDVKAAMEKDKKRAADLEQVNSELQAAQAASLIIMEDLDIKGKELSALNTQLKQEIVGRKHAQDALRMRTYDLGERVKELDCLYKVLKLIAGRDMSIDQAFQAIIELIPPSWQYPSITCARIGFGEMEFATRNWIETKQRLSADIIIDSVKEGVIEVAYLEEKPEIHEGPFHKEERNLIDALAREIGRFIERKRVEGEIKTYTEELEQKNKELDDYTYIVSHDLKAPLITIQGFAHLLEKKYGEKLDEKALHYLDNLVTAANNLNELITDLLEFSRAGRKEIKLMKIILSKAVQKSLLSLQGMVEETEAKVSVSDDLPEVSYDAVKLGQVLNNLISNALKYSSPRRKPEIDIGWSCKEEEFVLWFKDNGMGIKKDDLSKIFQPFVRVSNDKKGTGIGLSIVKTIIERHGGKLWVESEPGVGSTFYMTILKDVKL